MQETPHPTRLPTYFVSHGGGPGPGTRAEHVLAAQLQPSDVIDFLDASAALIKPIEIHYLWRPQMRDQADDMVLEAAVNAMADAVVSFNLKVFGDAPRRFGIEVLLPRDALTWSVSNQAD